MERQKPYVITIVGPESSGKTTLARELAAHFRCPWVPEYAREYLASLGRPYVLGDLEAIAEGQLALLSKYLTIKSPVSAVGRQQFAVQSLRVPVDHNQFSGTPFLSFAIEEFGDMDRPLLVVDSGMLSLRMWARLKYGTTIPVVEEALANDATSMYVLCRPVLPWEVDALREAPSLLERAWIYNHYLNEVFATQSK